MTATAGGGLVARLVDQARDYGEFYLTLDEAEAIRQTLARCPHAGLGLAPGVIVNLADLPIHVLPPLETDHDQETP